MGVYTGKKPGVFSISYNVRYSESFVDKEKIKQNLWRTLDPNYIPTQSLIEQLLLNVNSFDDAVNQMQKTFLDSPCYVIIGGLKGNEGVVITRDFDLTVQSHWLSDSEWFIVQTNKDVFIDPDIRYLNAVRLMNELG